MRLSASLDLDNRQLISALGALLSYLRTNIFSLDDGLVTVADLQPLIVNEYLRMDSGTFQALQIFCEGNQTFIFSIFHLILNRQGLLYYCRSTSTSIQRERTK